MNWTRRRPPDVIFTNLDQSPDDRYNNETSFPIEGKAAIGETESSSAILIIPKVDVRAKVIFVALDMSPGRSWSMSGYTATLDLPIRWANRCRAGRG